jgi:uncharacterized repeat protein (TIGR01451 family)
MTRLRILAKAVAAAVLLTLGLQVFLTTYPAKADTIKGITIVGGLTPTPPPSLGGGISLADPELTKTVDPALALPNEAVTFTITTMNRGGQPATNLIISNPLPTGLIFSSATQTQGTNSLGTSASGSVVVTFNLGSLNAGQSATMAIKAIVSKGVIPPTDLVNTATLNWAGSPRTASTTLRITGGILPATGEHPDDFEVPGISLIVLGLLAVTTVAVAGAILLQRRNT